MLGFLSRRPGERWLLIALLAAGLSSFEVRPAGAAEAEPPSLRVLASYPVAGEPSGPVDIRWAGDSTVYLARYLDGVAETALGEKIAEGRRPVPSPRVLGGFGKNHYYARLAASSEYLVFASPGMHLAWRPAGKQADGEVEFHHKRIGVIDDLDLFGDKLLLLGGPNTVDGRFTSEEGVAWIGTLSSGLNDLKPLLFDPLGPGAPLLSRCGGYTLGAARFLPDGSFVVVPGFQPGIHLFNSEGRLVRAWSTDEIGLNTDCTAKNGLAELQTVREKRTEWVNRHRVLEEILALPEGPGFVVRSLGDDGQVRWDLKVLSPKGVRTFRIPVAGAGPSDRLRGDVRNGKIVLLLFDSMPPMPEYRSPGRILVAELP